MKKISRPWNNNTYNLVLRITFFRPFTSLRSLSTMRVRYGDVLFSLYIFILHIWHACVNVTCNTFLLRQVLGMLLVHASHLHQTFAAERLQYVLGLRVVLHCGQHVFARKRKKLRIANGPNVRRAPYKKTIEIDASSISLRPRPTFTHLFSPSRFKMPISPKKSPAFIVVNTLPVSLSTSRMPSAMMNISRATSPLRQIESPGVKMYAFIFSTKSCRNSGWHS